jgi:hypothetical protein
MFHKKISIIPYIHFVYSIFIRTALNLLNEDYIWKWSVKLLVVISKFVWSSIYLFMFLNLYDYKMNME